MKGPRTAILLLCCSFSIFCCAQDQPDKTAGIIDLPSKFFRRMQSKTAGLDGPNLQTFLQNSYYPSAAVNVYDLAPDIYECHFDGGSFKFYWYNGKAYMFRRGKLGRKGRVV